MKILIRLAIFLSLLFLFGGLLAVGFFGDQTTIKNNSNSDLADGFYSTKPGIRLSMQQIDSISSAANYHFTIANAE
ncbi:MAG: hypothetical protein ACYDA4_04915 [Ignavibacteriaceae bacterium]